MVKILFAKNVIGNDKELFSFLNSRFDILVATISGTQLGTVTNINKWTIDSGSKLFIRTLFVFNQDANELLDRVKHVFTNNCDGLVFHGQTTEEDADTLMLKFYELANGLKDQNYKNPIVFMVDHQVGKIDVLQKLQKLIHRDDFPKDLDIRSAVRIPTKQLFATRELPEADLHVIDFGPFDEMHEYDMVEEGTRQLNVIGYMTYDNMSDELRDVIRDFGGLEKKNVTALADLTIRNSPAGNIIKTVSNTPVGIKAGTTVTLLESMKYGSDTWNKVQSGQFTGWIAGVLGDTEYSR